MDLLVSIEYIPDFFCSNNFPGAAYTKPDVMFYEIGRKEPLTWRDYNFL
jgi:hypothetical protein